VTDVSVRFGGLVAVANLSCRVESSEIVGIIGPNGAGKTTLLNAISGFVRVDRGGRIVFGDEDLLRRPAHVRAELGLGRTFQNLELCPRDSVIDNVLAGAHLRYRTSAVWAMLGWPRDRTESDELAADARRVLRTFRIAEWTDARVADVPYPVKKRVQICRALMGRPAMLLLDEPGSGMTPAEKQQLREMLLELRQTTGIAMLVIEHDVGFLTAMCDRLLALNFGHLIAEGSCEEVTAHKEVVDAYLGTALADGQP
jgi:branched-chain amino acid transport system ATP-binding protein